MLRGGQPLIPEDEHPMLEMRGFDARERGIVERLGEIEADDFGKKGPAEPAHLESFAHVA